MRVLLAAAGATATTIVLARSLALARSAPARNRSRSLVPAPGPTGGATGRLALALRAAALPGGPQRWAGRWALAAVLAVAAALLAGGPQLAALAAALVLVLPVALLRLWRGRADDLVVAGLPGALEAVARSLRSGSGLGVALGEAAASTPGPLGADLGVLEAVAPAAGLVPALDAWARARPLPPVRLAVASLALVAEVGGAGARALDGVALTLRQGQATDAEVRSLSTQARLSGLVLAVAPVAFTALTAAADARTAAFLLRTGWGHACLAAGLGLDGLGAAWMSHLTRSTA